MIQIKTVSSSIVKPDGSLLTGSMIITPSDSFEFTDPVDNIRRLVGLDSVTVAITSGKVTAFNLAPTFGAGNDKTGIYYRVQFLAADGAQWQALWAIDGQGPSALEITDILPALIAINGTVYIAQPVELFVTTGARPAPDPSPTAIAEWRIVDGNGKTIQLYSWDGGDWRLYS